MTVRECMSKHKSDKNIKSFYLIPNKLSNQTFREPYYYYGHSIVNIGNVNDEIIDTDVVKTWIEDNSLVIIWKKE